MSPEISSWDRRDGMSDCPEWVEEIPNRDGSTWWAVHQRGRTMALAMFDNAEVAGAFVAGLIAERTKTQ